MTADNTAYGLGHDAGRDAAGGARGHDPGPGETRPPSLTEARALIATQRREYARRNAISSAPMFCAWGLAWMLGYAAMALAETRAVPVPSALSAYLFFAACQAAAGVFTFVYIVSRSRGIRGTSGRQGSLYGGAWMGGMLLAGVIIGRINSFMAEVGTPGARTVGALVSSAIPCLVVGVIFLVGAALWDEVTMGILGGWILASATAATMVGLPWAWWVMAVAGGGGMLVAGAVESLGSRQAGRLDHG